MASDWSPSVSVTGPDKIFLIHFHDKPVPKFIWVSVNLSDAKTLQDWSRKVRCETETKALMSTLRGSLASADNDALTHQMRGQELHHSRDSKGISKLPNLQIQLSFRDIFLVKRFIRYLSKQKYMNTAYFTYWNQLYLRQFRDPINIPDHSPTIFHPPDFSYGMWRQTRGGGNTSIHSSSSTNSFGPENFIIIISALFRDQIWFYLWILFSRKVYWKGPSPSVSLVFAASRLMGAKRGVSDLDIKLLKANSTHTN